MSDEGFFTDEQMERRFPGLHAGLPRWFLGGCNDALWPTGVPLDFDHVFLRELGLPAGRECCTDEAHEHYMLLKETGGWRVHKVSALVDRVVEALR